MVAATLPSLKEALWHMESFMQFVSMTEQQRARQGRINDGISGCPLFKSTNILTLAEMYRYYGSRGQYSIWNNLPVPPVRNLDGVSYVSPQDIVHHLLATASPTDHITISKQF